MKVCVICFDFKKENIRRQPWKYIYELSKGLAEKGTDLVVITDSGAPSIDSLKICNVKKINSIFGETREILDTLKKENADIVVMLLGLTSFLRLSFKIDKQVIGILTSPIYSLGEILRVGVREFLRHFNYVFIHLIGALTPHFLIKKRANYFKHIVVLSEYNKRRLKDIGFNTKISVILPGIDEFYLEIPPKDQLEKLRMKINPKNIPILMYFTSPLTLRGTDTLVKAFVKVRKITYCKLIILSRREHKELVKEEKLLKEIAREAGIINSIEIISKYLSPKEVKEHLSITNIVCLPFKFVISDVPISILEAMALGKPVISTNVNGIPELLNGRGLVVEPNSPEKLAEAIMRLLNDKELASELGEKSRKYMENYPRWEDVGEKFLEIIQELR